MGFNEYLSEKSEQYYTKLVQSELSDASNDKEYLAYIKNIYGPEWWKQFADDKAIMKNIKDVAKAAAADNGNWSKVKIK